MEKYEKGDLVTFKGTRLSTPNIITRGRILEYKEEEIKPFFGKKYIEKYYLIENLDAYHCGDGCVAGSIIKINPSDVYYKIKY